MIELHGNAERADTARVKEKIHELSLRYRDKTDETYKAPVAAAAVKGKTINGSWPSLRTFFDNDTKTGAVRLVS
jgi:hypothetical protein